MGEDSKKANTNLSISLLMALGAHLCWGSYPVISKRLLLNIPPFALVGAGYLGVLILFSPRLLRVSWRESLLARSAWLLMLISTLRMITNILSIQATRATYVQLINLSTPFAVAILGRLLFRERIPRYTVAALTISTIGSILVILREPSLAIFHQGWRAQDSVGIALALASNLFLALYMLLTRYEQAQRGIETIVVFAQQGMVLMVTALAISLFSGEQWGERFSLWRNLPISVWLLFGVFVLIDLIGGNMLQITSLSRLGAPLFTSLMGARLVAALALGAILLGERLNSYWQVVGVIMVIGSVTTYMLLQAQVKTDNG